MASLDKKKSWANTTTKTWDRKHFTRVRFTPGVWVLQTKPLWASEASLNITVQDLTLGAEAQGYGRLVEEWVAEGRPLPATWHGESVWTGPGMFLSTFINIIVKTAMRERYSTKTLWLICRYIYLQRLEDRVKKLTFSLWEWRQE